MSWKIIQKIKNKIQSNSESIKEILFKSYIIQISV